MVSIYHNSTEFQAFFNGLLGEVRTLSDLLRIGRVLQIAARSHLWYRGHRQSDWKLWPTLIREGYDEKAEREMIGEFRSKARCRDTHCPGEDAVATLCWAQHYRLPTRLLDWSGSLLVAAYFAVEDNSFDKYDSAIWALSQGIINFYLTGDSRSGALHESHLIYPLADTYHVADKPNDPIFDVIAAHRSVVWSHPNNAELREKRHSGGLLPGDRVFIPGIRAVAVTSPHPESRMFVQHGAFTCHKDTTPLEEIPVARQGLHRITIPRGFRAEIRAELQALCGIDLSTLFPDLEHLATHLKTKTVKDLRKQMASQTGAIAAFDECKINIPKLPKFPVNQELLVPREVSFTESLDEQSACTTTSIAPIPVAPHIGDDGRRPSVGDLAEVTTGWMRGFKGTVEKYDVSTGIAELAFDLFGLRQFNHEVRGDFSREQFKLFG
jgi:hypothetical protein